jgi:glucokinase
VRSYYAGVDVGGTTVTTQLVDADLQPVHELTVATDTSSPDATLESIVHGITLTLQAAGIPFGPIMPGDIDSVSGTAAGPAAGRLAAIGLGIPGAVDAVNGISVMAVNLHWYGYPVAPRLQAQFGVPVFLENDVRVAALGVHQFDNPAACQDLVYVSIGTGVAAGIVLDGQLLRGRNGLAGEVGHFIVDPDGPPCNCGARGCLETLVSATAVIRLARTAVESGAQTELRNCIPLTAKAVYDAAAAGDFIAQEIVTGVGTKLGIALRNIIMAYDVDTVVLGGGVTRAGDRYLQPILAEWARQRAISPFARAMLLPEKLRIADLTRNMGAWGAVALAARRPPV